MPIALASASPTSGTCSSATGTWWCVRCCRPWARISRFTVYARMEVSFGPFLEDYTPLRFAELVEREFGGFVAPPGF